MTEAYFNEFVTVDAVLSSAGVTARVDALALCWLKAERQMRRLMTNAVFQSPAFGPSDVEGLRGVLAKNTGIYFRHTWLGYERLIGHRVSELVGKDFDDLQAQLALIQDHRNKLFHGQLTELGLDVPELDRLVALVRQWCSRLAEGAMASHGYDGFARDSFRKTAPGPLALQLASIKDYEGFLDGLVEKPRR